jgi:hypothetical protein
MKPVIATILAVSVAGCMTQIAAEHQIAEAERQIAEAERLAGPATKYDTSWHRAAYWSGEYPHGFTMTANVTIRIRSTPDPDVPRSKSCALRKGATYHPWNRSRVASDQLEFVTFTRIQTFELQEDYTVKLTPEPGGGSATIAFKKGDRWSYLANFGEGQFLIRVGGGTYRTDQDLYQRSAEVGAPADRRQRTYEDREEEYRMRNHEWVKLKCANGAAGWIFYNEVRKVPGFSDPNECGYGCAEDRKSGAGSPPDKSPLDKSASGER